MIDSKLNSLQRDFLAEFFRRENGFFLTGGAALSGFYLGHRRTEDLDLFTLRDEIESGARIVSEVAREIGGSSETIQTSPDFRRYLVSRGDETVVVDLVREYVYQLENEKNVIQGIRVDTPDEILANKLCALLSRSEIRDLVDVYQLEKLGYDISRAVAVAGKKDRGFNAAQLSWVLSNITIRDDAQLPGNADAVELNQYLDDLIVRLAAIAYPD